MLSCMSVEAAAGVPTLRRFFLPFTACGLCSAASRTTSLCPRLRFRAILACSFFFLQGLAASGTDVSTLPTSASHRGQLHVNPYGCNNCCLLLAGVCGSGASLNEASKYEIESSPPGDTPLPFCASKNSAPENVNSIALFGWQEWFISVVRGNIANPRKFGKRSVENSTSPVGAVLLCNDITFTSPRRARLAIPPSVAPPSWASSSDSVSASTAPSAGVAACSASNHGSSSLIAVCLSSHGSMASS
mmetsp:Transcript_35893/g.65878  ORF Transcript_35893/g.65878 Transcript_35893/m.65878 type:complete len:246 (-) Transcript_35893:912-1649(-)